MNDDEEHAMTQYMREALEDAAKQTKEYMREQRRMKFYTILVTIVGIFGLFTLSYLLFAMIELLSKAQ